MSLQKINETLTKYFEEIQVPTQVDQQIQQIFTEYHTKKEKHTMKKKILAFSVAAAILIPTGAYAFNNSYFGKNNVNLNGLVDNGVKQAVSKGLTVPIDYKLTDRGVTLHFKEVYSEDSKVLVYYRIEKEDGTLIPYEFDTKGLDVHTNGKKNGLQDTNPTYSVPGQEGFNVLNFIETDNADHLPFYLTDQKGNKLETGIAIQDKPEGLIAFKTAGNKLPQPLTLHVVVDRIGGIKGSWKGEIPIVQSKAGDATKNVR